MKLLVLFIDTTEKFGKEEFRKTLAEFITKERTTISTQRI